MGDAPELITSGWAGRADGMAVSEDDFEEVEESESFIRIKKNIRNACNTNTKPLVRKKAINWIFEPGNEDKNGITFDLCCAALESRGDLLRVRLQHQFFESHIISEPLPFMSYSIPNNMMSEIDYLCKKGSLEIAKLLWENPGIRLDILAEKLNKQPAEIEPLIKSIENTGYAGFWLGHGWFIGKNPSLMSKEERMRFKWSELVI
jgi:hypothetical protein